MGVHPYYVWEPQEAEPGIFRLEVEGDLYFQCLQEHLPDDKLWPWFEEWKTASAAYLYDCRQLVHWIIEECEGRTGTRILLDREWPLEGIFWYFAQTVYFHCTYLAGGYRGLKRLAYATNEAPSRLPEQERVHTLSHGGAGIACHRYIKAIKEWQEVHESLLAGDAWRAEAEALVGRYKELAKELGKPIEKALRFEIERGTFQGGSCELCGWTQPTKY